MNIFLTWRQLIPWSQTRAVLLLFVFSKFDSLLISCINSAYVAQNVLYAALESSVTTSSEAASLSLLVS